jgi:hypothetical protein
MSGNSNWAENHTPWLAQALRESSMRLDGLRRRLAGSQDNLSADQRGRFAHLLSDIGHAELAEREALDRISYAEAFHKQQKKNGRLNHLDAEEIKKDPEYKKSLVLPEDMEPEERGMSWFWMLLLWLMMRRSLRTTVRR